MESFPSTLCTSHQLSKVILENKDASKTDVDAYKKEVENERQPTKKDWEGAKDLAEALIKLCNDSNKDVDLFKNQSVRDMCKENKMRICGLCLSSNCLKTNF